MIRPFICCILAKGWLRQKLKFHSHRKIFEQSEFSSKANLVHHFVSQHELRLFVGTFCFGQSTQNRIAIHFIFGMHIFGVKSHKVSKKISSLSDLLHSDWFQRFLCAYIFVSLKNKRVPFCHFYVFDVLSKYAAIFYCVIQT